MLQCPPAIQRELDRLHLTCLDEQWRTRKSAYRLRCLQGHEFDWQADSLIALKECPECRNARKLERMLLKAAQEGSECLDGWLGSTALYRFRCLKNPSHEWSRAYSLALRTARCPFCSVARAAKNKMKPDGLHRIQAYAQSRGGECLSQTYLGVERPHEFRCAQGHTWATRVGNMVRLKQWCPQCRNDQQRHTLEEVRATAAARGGRFLASACGDGRALYEWACALGHTWKTTYASIRDGTWCPHCAHDNKRLDLQTLQAAAQALGGVCLSEVYTNSKANYLWQCAKGHIWKAKYAAIRNGHWCQRCHIESRKLTLEHMQETARERGGLCLSMHYEGARAHYQWQCARGHTWRAMYVQVRAGTWCPACYHMSLTKAGSAAWHRYRAHKPRD